MFHPIRLEKYVAAEERQLNLYRKLKSFGSTFFRVFEIEFLHGDFCRAAG